MDHSLCLPPEARGLLMTAVVSVGSAPSLATWKGNVLLKMQPALQLCPPWSTEGFSFPAHQLLLTCPVTPGGLTAQLSRTLYCA